MFSSISLAIHILHSVHKYGPVETTMSLLHFADKSKWPNTLENYYIQFFHECNIIGKEQTHKEKTPLFELSCNLQQCHTCT